MRKLNRKEEIEILKYCDEDTVLACGSSRIVFDLDVDVAARLGLTDRDYVVKVAYGRAGLNQMNSEIEVYKEEVESDFLPSNYLADIMAEGKFVEIMEKVKPVYCGDLDWVDECWDLDDEDEIYASYYDLFEDCCEAGNEMYSYILAVSGYKAATYLASINGTSDGGQVGLARGRVVSFDYGFKCEENEGCGYYTNDICRESVDNGFYGYYSMILIRMLEQLDDECYNEMSSTVQYYIANLADTEITYLWDNDEFPIKSLYRNDEYTQSVSDRIKKVILKNKKVLDKA